VYFFFACCRLSISGVRIWTRTVQLLPSLLVVKAQRYLVTPKLKEEETTIKLKYALFEAPVLCWRMQIFKNDDKRPPTGIKRKIKENIYRVYHNILCIIFTLTAHEINAQYNFCFCIALHLNDAVRITVWWQHTRLSVKIIEKNWICNQDWRNYLTLTSLCVTECCFFVFLALQHIVVVFSQPGSGL